MDILKGQQFLGNLVSYHELQVSGLLLFMLQVLICLFVKRDIYGLTLPQAFEEVQGFLSSSHSISAFGDLAEALDVKWQAFDKLTALLKDQTLSKLRMIQHSALTYKLAWMFTHSHCFKRIVVKSTVPQNISSAS